MSNQTPPTDETTTALARLAAWRAEWTPERLAHTSPAIREATGLFRAAADLLTAHARAEAALRALSTKR